MIDINIFNNLSKSKFRRSFHLKEKDKLYIKDKGIDKIREHAKDFIIKRLKVKLENDGKQTPYRGHPIFVAQHATGLCCRGCMYNWYKVPPTKELSDEEIEYFTEVIMEFIRREI